MTRENMKTRKQMQMVNSLLDEIIDATLFTATFHADINNSENVLNTCVNYSFLLL